MMLSVLLLLSAVDLILAKNFNVRCNNDTERSGMAFEPVGGEYLGRYTLELCTEVDPATTEWETIIYYYNNIPKCPPSVNHMWMLTPKIRMHSRNVEWTKFDSNCTNVCLTKEFDLIFSGCYAISSRFLKDDLKPRFSTYSFNVTSSFNIAMIKANRATVDIVNHDDNLTVIWHTGVPPTDYIVEMCDAPDQNKSMIYEEECVNVSSQCANLDWKTVSCVMTPPQQCVRLKLVHLAPWISGPLHPQGQAPYLYCPRGGGRVSVSGSRWAAAACGAALGGAALCGVAARRLCASRRAQLARKRVLKAWLAARPHAADAGGEYIGGQVESTKMPRNILLVYARENHVGQRVVDALKAVLEQVVDGEVWDIHSAHAVRMGAGVGAAWARGVAARRDVKLLLLQTPALRALHAPHGPSPPPGAARTARRTPAWSDGGVALLLRLLQDSPLAHAYRTAYLATLSGLETEVLERAVPYRRYVLPRDVALLARDASQSPAVAPPTPPCPLVGEEALIAAHKEFLDYVTDNPDYLMDDLIVLDEDNS